MSNLLVEIKRINQKVHFEGVSVDNPNITIPFDFAPPYGDGQGFGGLELLLMSFAGCVSTAIVVLLNRTGKHITSYSAKFEGFRTEKPLSLSAIKFHISVGSEDLTNEDVEGVIKAAADLSPVWLAVKHNVAVESSYEINR